MHLNIFKIRDSIDIVKESLMRDRNLSLISRKENIQYADNNYNIEFYFKNNDATKDIEWVEYFRNFLEIDEILNSSFTTNFGIILIYCNEYSYGISFGRAYSYLIPFCNIDFGLDLASKMLTSDSIVSKSSKYFKLTKNKALTVYNVNTLTSFEFGEANEFLYGRLVIEDDFKIIEDYLDSRKIGYFGASAKLCVDMKAENIVEFIYWIHNIYIFGSIKVIIPRLKFLNCNTDSPLIERLDTLLFEAVKNEEASISVSFYTILGTKIFINQGTKYQLYYGHRKLDVEDLDVCNIKNFIEDNNIENIEQIKVKIMNEETLEKIELKKILDFTVVVNENNYCLYEGKWAYFNDLYIEFIEEQIKEVNKCIHYDSRYDIDDNVLLEYRSNNSKLFETVKYREYVYNNFLSENYNFKLLDRERPQEKYKTIEFADLYDSEDKQLIHVKIGTVGSFNDCIKQSLYSTKIINSEKEIIEQLCGDEDVNFISLLLVFKHHSFITSTNVNINEIRSIIFKANVVDWYFELIQMGYNPRIYVAKHINKCSFSE